MILLKHRKRNGFAPQGERNQLVGGTAGPHKVVSSALFQGMRMKRPTEGTPAAFRMNSM